MSDLENLSMLQFQKELLSRVKKIPCKVVSDSMHPLLRVGDTVTVQELKNADGLQRFDLLIFLYEGKFFCHFLWHINRLEKTPTISTRSLKNPLNDDLPVPFELILGKVVDKRIPFWTRLKLLGANLMARSA